MSDLAYGSFSFSCTRERHIFQLTFGSVNLQ